MNLDRFPFQRQLRVPAGYRFRKTSDLLESGCFVYFKEPGLPYFNPLGEQILGRIRDIIRDEHLKTDALEIKMPGYMKRDILGLGDKIEETFEAKFVNLPEPMAGYMVMTTAEMELLHYLGQEQMSYRSMPMKLLTFNQILRPIKKPKGILKEREFEVAMMLILDADRNAFNESLESYQRISEGIFDKLSIPYKRCIDLNFDLEYFYLAEEGDNLELDGSGNRTKALSLSMGYEYMTQNKIVNITSRENKRLSPVVSTYGMGIDRCFYAAMDNCRDEYGFNLPDSMQPFYAVLIVSDPTSSKQREDANALRHTLMVHQAATGCRERPVLIDNRFNVHPFEKLKFSRYAGINRSLIISNRGISEQLQRNPAENDGQIKSIDLYVEKYRRGDSAR